ncbi:MAG: IPTL-CTERM sorting domain-containing protein [Ottowia sp.]|uniref:IPTL-CTERM sorting domain-containing protein n=1 Tax=Ottowia sp. TaxID=1898956 RepID=UPI0039E43315
MPIHHHTARRHLGTLLAGAALAAATGASAAPFATTYAGQVAESGFGTVSGEQDFRITLVFDNGNATAGNQTWEASNLRCILWRFNNSQNVVYAQNLVAAPPTDFGGAAHTDASGALDGFFSSLIAHDVTSAQYTASGFVPALNVVHWHINNQDSIFSSQAGADFLNIEAVGDGVSTAPERWSNPAPYAGNCAAATTTTPPAAVPTLGHAGLALLAAALGALGWRGRRRGT